MPAQSEIFREHKFDPPASGMRSRVLDGALLIGSAQAVRVLTQIGSVIVLSRLLSPSDFGVVAMAWPVVALVMLFQDMGLGQAIVQKSRLEHDEVSAIFWVSALAGAMLSLLLVLLAPAVGWYFHDTRPAHLAEALAAVALVSSLSSQPSAILTRRMRFGWLALVNALGALSGLAASIGWALIWPSYWALYVGNMTAALLSLVTLWLAANWCPSLPRRMAQGGGLLRFGSGLTVANFMTYVSRNLDNVLIGRYWGGDALGLYDRAYKLLLFPLQQVNTPLAKVMIPALSRMADDPSRYRQAYLRALGFVLTATMPGVAFAVGTARLLFPTVLGQKWQSAAPIFIALGVAGLVQPLNNPSGWLYISQGRSTEFMHMGILSAAFCVAAFIIGMPFGPVGVAIAYSTGEYLRMPILWWYVGRRGPVGWRDVFGVAIPNLLGALVSLAGARAVQHLLPGHPWGALVLAAVCAYLLSFAVLFGFRTGRATLKDVWSLLRGTVRRYLLRNMPRSA